VFQGSATSYQTDCVISSNSRVDDGYLATRWVCQVSTIRREVRLSPALEIAGHRLLRQRNTLNDDFTDLVLIARGLRCWRQSLRPI
jgi:hypothetical protein